MKPKITYLAVYSQFNNLKLADNKLCNKLPLGDDPMEENWSIFKNKLKQDCLNYSDCKYCPYSATLLNICIRAVIFSWVLNR